MNGSPQAGDFMVPQSRLTGQFAWLMTRRRTSEEKRRQEGNLLDTEKSVKADIAKPRSPSCDISFRHQWRQTREFAMNVHTEVRPHCLDKGRTLP